MYHVIIHSNIKTKKLKTNLKQFCPNVRYTVRVFFQNYFAVFTKIMPNVWCGDEGEFEPTRPWRYLHNWCFFLQLSPIFLRPTCLLV